MEGVQAFRFPLPGFDFRRPVFELLDLNPDEPIL